MKVSVCNTCTEGSRLGDALRAVMKGVDVQDVDCMSGCTRPQTVAFRDAGKVAYLFGDIDERDIADLQNFVALYAASVDGTFADARVLGNLRTKAIARIPG